MSEFEMQDAEAIDMVRGGQKLPRAEVHFVPAAEYERIQEMRREYPYLKEVEKEYIQRRQDDANRAMLRRKRFLFEIIARACLAALFLMAVLLGWMAESFGMTLVVACILWAIVHYLRGPLHG